jgi:FlaA1/EpsC-like NDP-sugar epimerase
MIRLFNHYLSTRVLILTLIEAIVLFQAMVLGVQVRHFGQSVPFPLVESLCFTLVMLMMMTALGLYDTLAEEFKTTIQRVIVAYLMTLVVLSVIFYLIPQTYVGRSVFALASVFAVASLLLVRMVMFKVSDVGLPKRRVLILGNGREAEDLIRFLHEGVRGKSVQYAGLYPVTGEKSQGNAERSVSHEHFLRTVADLRVNEVVIAVKERRGGVLPLRQLLDAKLKGVVVSDLAI